MTRSPVYATYKLDAAAVCTPVPGSRIITHKDDHASILLSMHHGGAAYLACDSPDDLLNVAEVLLKVAAEWQAQIAEAAA